MRTHLAKLGLAATIVLAGCAGRGAAPAGPTVQPSATDAPAATASPAASVPLALDLPDLSAVEGDLGGIDGDLAADASAPTDEGSDQ